jgi:hypothetical protein
MKALVILEPWRNVKQCYPTASKQRYRDFCVAISNKLLNDPDVSWVEAKQPYPEELWINWPVKPDQMMKRDYDMVLTFGVNDKTFAGRASEFYASLEGVLHYELLYSWEKYYARTS